MFAQLIQLSDFHLFQDREHEFEGLKPYHTLCDVLQYIRNHFPQCKHLLMTGDIAHDERTETYWLLREMIKDWFPRCRIIPGNHDFRPGLKTAIPEAVEGSAGEIYFSIIESGWLLLGLDTHFRGFVEGRLESRQLDWLRTELERHRDHPTMLFLHHPPIDVGSTWLDEIGLQNRTDFAEAIRGYRQIKAVFVGHVHQEFTGKLGAVKVFGTPSTSIQFTPCTIRPEYDTLPPGFRLIELDSRAFRTRVIRLPAARFQPRRRERPAETDNQSATW